MSCENCDRETCPTLTTDASLGAYGGIRVRPDQTRTARLSAARMASKDCRAHAVDWRAEAMRLREVLDNVRAHSFTAKHEADCVAHVHGGRYCTCWVERWQEGYDAALEAVAGILGEEVK